MAIVYLTPEFDTYVNSRLPDKNFSTEPLLYAGFVKTDHIYRSLIKFNLRSIPFPAYINKGMLRLFLCSDDYNFTKCIDIHRIVSPYNGETVSYNTQPEFLLNYESSAVLHNEKPQFVQWDITELVKGWHSGRIVNYGLLLKSRSEKRPGLVSFSSLECGYSPNVPLLLLEFSNKDLFESTGIYTADAIPANTNVFNTFCYKMVTFFVSNQGSSDVTVSVEVSPDCINWYEEQNTMTVAPGATTALVPRIFAKYTRLKFWTKSGSTTIKVQMQGQG